MSRLQSPEIDAGRQFPPMKEVLAELGTVLAQHAAAGTPARMIYADALEELLVRFEYLANGAQVMEVFSAFNKEHAGDASRLPLGTAGTANEAVATFRVKLARGYRSRLTLESLPNEMGQRVAGMFDAIVTELRASVAASYEVSFAAARESHFAELSNHTSEWEAKNLRLREEIDALKKTDEEATQLISELQRQVASDAGKLREAIAAQDSLQSRFQLASSREVASKVRIETLETRKTELNAEVLRLQGDLAENRRDQLLLIDKCHQLELSRQATAAEISSSTKRFKEVERLNQRAEAEAARYLQKLEGAHGRIAELESKLFEVVTASTKQDLEPVSKRRTRKTTHPIDGGKPPRPVSERTKK